LNDTTSTASLIANELETGSGSRLKLDAAEAGLIHEHEGSFVNEEDSDDDEAEIDVEAGRENEDDNDGSDDPNDRDYAGDSDAVGSNPEERPYPAKRPRQDENMDDAAGKTPRRWRSTRLYRCFRCHRLGN
jgi:hypothetical protein